jgi:hypothetical protein
VAYKSPIQILRRSVSPQKPPDCRAKLRNKHLLTLVYLIGLRQSKIGQFRKDARELGLSLQHVYNISFIGTSIVELLVESSMCNAFVDQAKQLRFTVSLDLDITSKTKNNPVWLRYPDHTESLASVVKSNFIRRVSHEIKSSTNERVRQYYLEWAKALGWEKSLLVTSTVALSP